LGDSVDLGDGVDFGEGVESVKEPHLEEEVEEIVNEPDFDEEDFVEEDEEHDEVRLSFLGGEEVGVVTGLGFVSSMEVVMDFFSFLNFSWELCFALEASDSEAMVEGGTEELFLTPDASKEDNVGEEKFFFTDFSEGFLLNVASFLVTLNNPFSGSSSLALCLLPLPVPCNPVLLA